MHEQLIYDAIYIYLQWSHGTIDRFELIKYLNICYYMLL